MNRLEILANEPLFWSRVGMAQDPTKLDSDGNILFYDDNWEDFIKEHKNFLEKGVKVHTSIIHNGWVGVDKYDYSAADKTIEAICSISPEIMYVPRIKLNVPVDWAMENPEEICLTQNVERTPWKIRELVEKMRPYYHTNWLTDDAPKEDGVASLQSFSSEKWLNDASIALEKLINHLENGKYGKQILAYQVGFGMCGENANWGAWGDQRFWGDYGITNNRKFYDYCINKFGSDEEIEKHFGIIGVNDKMLLVPHYTKRGCSPKTVAEFFRDGNEAAITYSEYMSDVTVNAICYLAQKAKDVSKKPVGTFYGYVFTSFPTESGHVGIQKLIDSDSIDFIASPKGYYRWKAGDPGGTQSTSTSVQRKKIWIDELDNDTYIATAFHNIENHPTTLEETKTVMWREVVKNLTWRNQNFWWMDLRGGWFLEDEIMSDVGKLYNFVKGVKKTPYKNVSEILFVIDERSLIYQNCDRTFMGSHHKGVMNEMGIELKLCGAPVEECRLNDVRNMTKEELSNYKMIVFANTFLIDNSLREHIKNNISKETICIWNYAPGVRNPDFDLKNVSDLIGIDIADYDKDYSFSNGYNVDTKLPPLKIINNDDIEVIDTYEDGEIKTARNKNNILCASPCFKATDFNKYAKLAGCHMYAPCDCTVYADNRIVGVFPKENKEQGIDFPDNGYKYKLYAVAHGETDNIKKLEAKNGYIFVNEDLKL